MNPARNIWLTALAACAAAALLIAAATGYPEGVAVIFVLVAIASLGSLLGFYLLFEALAGRASRKGLWVIILTGVPAIVVLNSFFFIAILTALISGSNPQILSMCLLLLPVTAIPAGGALLGVVACQRRINAFPDIPSSTHPHPHQS